MKGFKGDCRAHPANEDWLFSKVVGAKLCVGCVRDGFYVPPVTEEMATQYPDYFKSPESHQEYPDPSCPKCGGEFGDHAIGCRKGAYAHEDPAK